MYPFASDGDDDNVDEDDSIPGSYQLLSDEGVVFLYFVEHCDPSAF